MTGASGNSFSENSSLGLTEHSVRGEINKIVYQNPEGSYSVVKMLDAENSELTLVGCMPGSAEGQTIEAKGVWESHKEYGRQLRVNFFRLTLPSTEAGIRKYLGSGVITGIGGKTAEKIVDHFGVKTLEILDSASGRLKEVPGLGKKKIGLIRKAWTENKEKRETLIFLQSLGMGPGQCEKIVKQFGAEAGNIVKGNPYCLADEINGIGFILSDRAASSLGIGKNDAKRLKAGVAYVFKRLSEEGHCCYPERLLVRKISELLGIEDAQAEEALKEAVSDGRAVIDQNPAGVSPEEKLMAYDIKYYKAETALAARVRAMSAQTKHAGRAILRVPPEKKTIFGEEQIQAVESAGKYPLSIITGGPGVGKTTVVGEIVRRCKAAKLKILLAAPTGRAAKRLSESTGGEAKTIHRLLKWAPMEKKFYHGRNNPLECDVLIADESSMLDLPLALQLFRAIPNGATTILVGDADQLPSVGPGNVLHDFINSGLFCVSKLTRIYRQAEGSRIITGAHAVNRGRMPDLSPIPREKLGDFYWIEEDDPEKMTRLVCEMASERIPKRFGFDPVPDIQIITPMNKGQCGVKAFNELLQAKLNPGPKPQFQAGERVFKSGDKVMQVSNNYEKSVFNGDMGKIAQIRYDDKEFDVVFDDQKVKYMFSEHEQLQHAYAITIHKSQGSEFPAVIVPVMTQHYIMLQRKLIYTAMTRAKKLLILAGSSKALSMAVNNASAEPRHTMLCQRLKEKLPEAP